MEYYERASTVRASVVNEWTGREREAGARGTESRGWVFNGDRGGDGTIQ